MARQIAAANLQDRLAENPYPGRGIVQGKSSEGDWVQVYWIMGRSANSRNRIFVHEDDLVRTEAAELGISCEACHGAGRKHVVRHAESSRVVGSAVTKPVVGSADPTIVNPARLDHRGASRVCGQCHSTFLSPDQEDYLANGYRYRPGDDLSTAFQTVLADSPLHTRMEQLGKPVYWTDGACWVGGREYLGHVDSQCHTVGKMSCLSCHSMHDAPSLM